MSTYFYAAPIVYGSTVVVEGVGAAAGVGVALALSNLPSASAGTATGHASALGVGAYSVIHHVALPRPAPGETNCDC